MSLILVETADILSYAVSKVTRMTITIAVVVEGRSLAAWAVEVSAAVEVAALVVAASAAEWVAAAVPLLMPRVTIAVMQLTGMYKKDEQKGEERDHER